MDHPLLKTFDNLLRTGLEIVLNLSLADSHWAQASLSVKADGLGIRRVTLLALPAFLASAAGTRCLQSAMLKGCRYQMTNSTLPYGIVGARITQVHALMTSLPTSSQSGTSP